MSRSLETDEAIYTGLAIRTSRKVLFEFAGVFLIGVLVGGLTVWDFTDTTISQFMSKTSDSESVIAARTNAKYAQQYHLSQEELDRIQPLVAEMAHQITQTRRQFGIDILATMDEYHEKIAAQLSPDHRAAYEKATQKRKKQLSALLLPDQQASDPSRK